MKRSCEILILTCLIAGMFTCKKSPTEVESRRPSVTLDSVLQLNNTSVMLKATVSPEGYSVTYHFEYGTTPNKDLSTSPQDAGSGNAPVRVTAMLTNLTPEALYHWRVMAVYSGGTIASRDTAFATSHLVDYWPMVTGNTWTFAYSFHNVHPENHGVGTEYFGSYSGTLTWEIVSTIQTDTGFKSTFREKFVGVANELRIASLPGKLDTVNYSINDTACFFDLYVGSNLIISLSSATQYPVWQEGYLSGCLAYVQPRRYLDSKAVPDSIVTYSPNFSAVSVKLARGVGPMIVSWYWYGNSSDSYMNASLLTYTLRKQ